MKTISNLFLLALSFAFVACGPKSGSESDNSVAMEPLDRSKRPDPGPAPESSFPSYDTIETDEGLTLYVIESDRQPTVTYRLMFRSGGLFDGEKTGLAEFVASMLDQGVKGKSAFELASEIDFIGASLSASASCCGSPLPQAGLQWSILHRRRFPDGG